MPIKIVLVEDSETVQIAAKMVMQSEREYEILCLKNTRELETIEKAQPDLFIIDWSLFDESATDRLNDRPVVFLIGPQALTPTISRPKSHFLKKPFDSQSLLKSIQGALADEQKAASRPTFSLPPMDKPRPQPQAAPLKAAEPSVSMPTPGPIGAPNLPIHPEELRAMARKIIEEVAWEVVPELAESIIREEIRRLTKEGR